MIKINISTDYSSKLNYRENAIKTLAKNIFSSNDYNNVALSIIFSNRKYLNKLKKKYFDLDYYTDVIAFNLSDNNDCLEGEIYISVPQVRENAKQYNQAFNKELSRIIIHGSLHLLNYKDKTPQEKIKMTEKEDYFLNKITGGSRNHFGL